MLHELHTTSAPEADTIPVWSRAIGSWRFSIGRQAYGAAELEGHYDKASRSWHTTITRLGFEGAYAGLVQQALPELASFASDRSLDVLDAGIGTGAMAAAFAAHCGRPVHLTGMDVSCDMLQEAAQNLRPYDVTTRMVQGDLHRLPFADNTFDVVLAAHVLEHMADPAVALAEMHRVLRPGGVIIACVTRRSAAGFYIQLKWRTHRAGTQTVVRWLQECGLVDVRTIPLEQGSAGRLSCGYIARKVRL